MNEIGAIKNMRFCKRENYSNLLQLSIAQFVVSKAGQNGTN